MSSATAAAAISIGIPFNSSADGQSSSILSSENAHQQFYITNPTQFSTITANFDRNNNINDYHYPPPSIPPHHQQNHSQHFDGSHSASLLLRRNELYHLEAPSSIGYASAVGLDQHPKRATLCHPYQHNLSSQNPLPMGYPAMATGDIYLRVGATLEIGTSPAAIGMARNGGGGGMGCWPHHPSNSSSSMMFANGCHPPTNHQNHQQMGATPYFSMIDAVGFPNPFGGYPPHPPPPSHQQIGPSSSSLKEENVIIKNECDGIPSKGNRRLKKNGGGGGSTSTRASLNVGGTQKCYICTVCGRQYCRKSTLKAHMKHHIGDRPFNCQICGKHFSQAANLTAHRRVHTGEKPFSCPICHRPFSQSSSLVTHKRTHTGERPYPCPHCEKAFTDSSTLTKHLRTHTGQKPYSCDLCTMKFSQSGNLHRHMKTHMNMK